MTQLALRKRPLGKSAVDHSVALEFVGTAFDTTLGWLAMAQRDEVVAGVVFGHATKRQAMEALCRSLEREQSESSMIDFVDAEEQPKTIRSVIERLERYAAGDEVTFGDVAVDERHLTHFGRRVAQACRRIPAGQTRSYGELAAACGSPGAARAVGQVMAKNRYPLVVPCHRVLAAGGLLGGFSAPQGLAMKRRLLAMEGAIKLEGAR
jgi:methylated-DNA-[protein]-cysteine S-methyltransferase